MDIATAVSTLLNLTNAAANMLAQAGQVSTMIQSMQAQGRTTFTQEEWAVIQNADVAARKQLAEAIVKALAV